MELGTGTVHCTTLHYTCRDGASAQLGKEKVWKKSPDNSLGLVDCRLETSDQLLEAFSYCKDAFAQIKCHT